MISRTLFDRRGALTFLGGVAISLGLPTGATAAIPHWGEMDICRKAADLLGGDGVSTIARRIMDCPAIGTSASALEDIVRSDYRAGRTVVVGSLILSETEACIAAALARDHAGMASGPNARALLALLEPAHNIG